MVRLQDIKSCTSCRHVVGDKDYNKEKIYYINIKFCPNCVRKILTWYKKNRRPYISMRIKQRFVEELPEKPEEVKEDRYNALRVEGGNAEDYDFCPGCCRLWRDSKRISIPKGKCLSCFNDDKKEPPLIFFYNAWCFGQRKI